MEANLKELSAALLTKRVVELRISCQEAAKQIGVTKATISRLENKKMPDLITYAKCCKWLGVTMNKFITPYKT